MKRQESESIIQPQSLINQPQKANNKILEKYKKRLLVQVITIFIICLVIILQRVFYQVIVDQEQSLLSNIQIGLGLIKAKGTEFIPDAISQTFLQYYGDLSDFHIQFLIITHFFATLYVAHNAFVTAKVIYITFGLIYIVSLLQMFYAGARPYWTQDIVLASSCQPSYNHPSLGLILMLFLPFYYYYCSRKKVGRQFLGTIPQYHLVIGSIVLLVILLIQFLNYLLGIMYIVNIVMSCIFFILIFMCLVGANSFFDKLIKKSTILKTDAKKYIFYWLLLICLLQTFILIVYSGQDLYLDIDWVQNYIQCTKYLQYPKRNYRFDQVVGPWFNFVQTSSVFGWIGAIFGISVCFRKIDSFEWYAGPWKQRIYRIVITNLFIVPSWLFSLFLVNSGQWIKDIGLNIFIIDGIHYFILYFWIFGYMPIYVLHKGLKLTFKDTQDQYVISEDK